MQSRDNETSDRLQTLSILVFFGWFGGYDGDKRRRNLTSAPPRCIPAASPSPLFPRFSAMTLSDRFDQMEAKRVIVKPGDITAVFFSDTTRSAKAVFLLSHYFCFFFALSTDGRCSRWQSLPPVYCMFAPSASPRRCPRLPRGIFGTVCVIFALVPWVNVRMNPVSVPMEWGEKMGKMGKMRRKLKMLR